MHFIKYLNNLSASPLAVPAVQRARRVTVTVRRTLINRKMLTFFLWGRDTMGVRFAVPQHAVEISPAA